MVFQLIAAGMVGDGSPFDMTLMGSPPPYKVAEASSTAECGDMTRLKGSTLGGRRRQVSRQSGRNSVDRREGRLMSPVEEKEVNI